MGDGFVSAQSQRTIQFTSTINPGALLTDIRDENGRSIVKPALDLGKVRNSVDCRSGSSPLNGTLGVNELRIYVDNPRAAFDGWTLSISPVGGNQALWEGAGNNSFDFNDVGSGGCRADA